MFWKGKVSAVVQLDSFLRQNDVALAKLEEPSYSMGEAIKAHIGDSAGIARLLDWFEQGKTRTAVTKEWIEKTMDTTIWIVIKDWGGTIRGCVGSFLISAPYPNSVSTEWGLVDWFCVHPLWRSKGLGSKLLKALDTITYNIGRKAHIFLKEGLPLPFHVPFYVTRLLCRKAGNPRITELKSELVQNRQRLLVDRYNVVERATEIPLLCIRSPNIIEWEHMLDTELPPCIVFVYGYTKVDSRMGWKTDSLVSMYAFRWIPGKWMGSIPKILSS